MTTNPQQPAPIRKSLLPCTPPAEWEFSSAFATGPDAEPGLLLVPGDSGPVVVRRRVTYGDWEPVRPERWAEEPPSEVRAVSVPAPAPTAQTALRDRIARAIHANRFPDTQWGNMPEALQDDYRGVADAVLAVLPTPTDRAAILREAANAIDATRAPFPIAVQNGITWATAELRRAAAASGSGRVADETQAERPRSQHTGASLRDCAACQPGGKACTCADAGDAFAPAGHYADCPQPAPAVVSQPETPARCGCPDENAVKHQFGGQDCDCVPWVRENGKVRYCQPGDTVDQISGWEIARTCPHHRPAVVSQPDGEA